MQRVIRLLCVGATVVSMFGAALPSVAQPDSRACLSPPRPITAAEKKLYEDGYAMFMRMAPPAPAGWTAEDSPQDKTITFTCGPTIFTAFAYSRTFNRPFEQARSDTALRKAEAVTARAEARQNANAEKLADLERRQTELAQRLATLAEQGKFAEMAPLSEQSDKLAAEREALVRDPEAEAASDAIGAEVSRDTTAMFTLAVGAEGEISSAYQPMAAPAGKGYRQDGEDKDGNPWVDFLIVLPPVAGAGGETRVSITGDPARAEGLLSATNFR
jgi:hypothetical protein